MEVMGFTDYDEDLNIDNILYKSSSGFTASSIILNSNLKTDNLEIEGILNSVDIKKNKKGKLTSSGAEVYIPLQFSRSPLVAHASILLDM
ncbi:conserved hypothetical protein [Wolbachia endosymbiont of Drosophila ananassae]|nr:conserved hypothetical protein [Wolbachia endosymbiont of Drosophila ananassae]